jgi:hypothetical protein
MAFRGLAAPDTGQANGSFWCGQGGEYALLNMLLTVFYERLKWEQVPLEPTCSYKTELRAQE